MIREVPGRKPRVHPDAYVDPQAAVIGDVTIDAGASVWPFTVLRGDQDNYVRLGKNSNVQDNSGGQIAMTRSLAVEWAPHGIRLNLVALGIIASPGLAKYPRTAEMWGDFWPLGRPPWFREDG